jgi:hypothetical protein
MHPGKIVFNRKKTASLYYTDWLFIRIFTTFTLTGQHLFIAFRSLNASFSLSIKVSSPFLSHTLGS